uniref:Uncharacterized protein n=1 Tax=Octopus bimaculoides TaxID=37653 RepID=A0A0L8FMK0_OCTBM
MLLAIFMECKLRLLPELMTWVERSGSPYLHVHAFLFVIGETNWTHLQWNIWRLVATVRHL